MDKCVACQFYDRQLAKPTDARGVQWGQCRRAAPMLHPINAKSYMIEGVWPHVRDDDWCGEWKGSGRPLQVRPSENRETSHVQSTASPSAARAAVLAAMQTNGALAFPATVTQGALSAVGRGD